MIPQDKWTREQDGLIFPKNICCDCCSNMFKWFTLNFILILMIIANTIWCICQTLMYILYLINYFNKIPYIDDYYH